MGLSGIGVWRQKLSDCGEEAGIDLICESNLEVSSLMWAGGFTGYDGRSHSDSIEDGIEAIGLAAAMRAGCLVVYTGGRGCHTRKHARRITVNALRELAQVAFDLDVTLALEPVHAGCEVGWSFVHGVDDALRMLDEVASDSLKLVFDTYHLGQELGIVERLERLVDRIALVHLGDAKVPPCGEQNRCKLGEGILPLDEILTTLDQVGYNGFCEIELIGQDIEDVDYSELLKNSIDAVQQIVRVAQ
jgi:sugar phosphate isomerase/epimerase